MSGHREIKGFWWVPDHSETRWFGTLTLRTNHSPELDLIIERHGWTGSAPPPIGRVVHGMDEQGTAITLLFVCSSCDTFTAAVLKRKCLAGYALIGTSILGEDSFSAQSIRFQTQHLYGWLGRSGFDRGTTHTARSFNVRYEAPDDGWFSINAGLELGIHTTHRTSRGIQEERIREDAALTFRSQSGLSFARCKLLVGAVRMLLHFASLEPVYSVWMTAQLTESGTRLDLSRLRRSVEIWSSGLRESVAEFQQPEQWIFRLEDVHQDFGGFMR